MGVCNCSMFCCALLYVHSSFAIILMGKTELVALFSLFSWCLVMDVWLFQAVPWVCLRFVVVVLPDHTHYFAGARSAVSNVSGYRCVSDCRSRGRESDPGPVPYFRGDWWWNNFYGHSPPFRWFIQEGLLSVTSESMCTNYWLTACSSLPRKKCG